MIKMALHGAFESRLLFATHDKVRASCPQAMK